MEKLKEHISRRLEEKKSCTVFPHQIAAAFSAKSALNNKLKEQIQKFADENGWEVKITDSGIRALFRKKNSRD